MNWCDIDGARDYAAQGASKKPSRKVVYGWVAAGMRVARLGDSGELDRRGRRKAVRLMFCSEWIDQFFQQRATVTTGAKPLTIAKRGAA